MCTCEETSKSQLEEIKHAMSHITSLRYRTNLLRRLSQDNHVKRMQYARNMGEHLSPVFILPSSSPTREPKRTQIDSPSKLKSPNKTAVKKEDDEQVKTEIPHKCKKINQNIEEVISKPSVVDCKKVSKVKDGKISPKYGKLKEISKMALKSTLSLGKFSKCKKSKLKEAEKKPIRNKVTKNKLPKDVVPKKISPKKIFNFYSQAPALFTTELGKGDTIYPVNCDSDMSFPKQMSPDKNLKPDIPAKNDYENIESKSEPLNSLNKNYVSEEKSKDDQIPKKHLNTPKKHLKRSVKKKSKVLPKHKTIPAKSSQNKGKKINESINNNLLSSANKTSMPINVQNTNPNLPIIEKKDSSILSYSLSLDSLDDRRKTLKATISPLPATIDKVLNFINDKKDLMASNFLENDGKNEKMVDNSEKQPSKPKNPNSGSKIPLHGFRSNHTGNHEKHIENFEEKKYDKFKMKDKEYFPNGCKGNTENKKSVVKSWLRSVPEVIQENETARKKARDLLPNSTNFITTSNAVERNKLVMPKNGKAIFPETKRPISASPKKISNSPGIKTEESEEPDSGTHSSTGTISITSSITATEDEIEERKRYASLKNSLGNNMNSLNFKFSTHGKEFLTNPIEKFMNEFNFGMSPSDSEEIITESSLPSTSKGKKEIKSKKK